MEVILAEYLGFCYGVKRAIQLARESATLPGKAYTLGPIIHNPQMVAKLGAEGIGLIDTLTDTSKGTVIIRSHGVGPQVYAEAEAKKIRLIDATCPHVKKAQLAAHKLSEGGYKVVIIGEKKHPEVRSILEWAGKEAMVVEDEAEAAELPSYQKLGVVAQTTFSQQNFQNIVMYLLPKSHDIRILRTICTATDQRQKAAMDLAGQVSLMLVIGGKNSANTTRLAQLCAAKCQTYHIETASEIQPGWFDKIEKIGITAGASTPDWIIKEVYKKCKTWKVY